MACVFDLPNRFLLNFLIHAHIKTLVLSLYFILEISKYITIPVRIMAMNPESAVVVATLDDIDTDLGTLGSSSKSLLRKKLQYNFLRENTFLFLPGS